ncbi:MAG: guanylate kinase [Acidobacteria bacterium]|nr:guanylate kinase [Acidobacteriota bacterium]
MIASSDSNPAFSGPVSGTLFIVSGPSGAGKSTLVSAVIKRNPGMQYCPSFTTRPQRPGEVDGREYHFVSREQFAEMVRRNELFEHATVYGHQYGRSKELILDGLRAGRDVVMNVDVQGAASARVVLPDSVSIFIMPPSLDVLRRRLEERGTEVGSMLERRLDIARQEIRRYPEFDYVLVNDDLDSVPVEFETIIHAERRSRINRGAWMDEGWRRAGRHRKAAMERTAEQIVATFAG